MERPTSLPRPALRGPVPLAWTLCGVLLSLLPLCTPCLGTDRAPLGSGMDACLQVGFACLLPSALYGPCTPKMGRALPVGGVSLPPALGRSCSPQRNTACPFATGVRQVWRQQGARSSGDRNSFQGLGGIRPSPVPGERELYSGEGWGGPCGLAQRRLIRTPPIPSQTSWLGRWTPLHLSLSHGSHRTRHQRSQRRPR